VIFAVLSFNLLTASNTFDINLAVFKHYKKKNWKFNCLPSQNG